VNQAMTTGEVRLDDGEATSFGPMKPSVLPFWLSTGSAVIEFRCGAPP
jgi:hypothetical protein